MNNNDYEIFFAQWSAMVDMQNGRDISDDAIQMAFDTLVDFTIDEVLGALMAHCRTNKWVAAPCEIIERIVGTRPPIEAMAGLARNPVTVLGVYIRQLVGSHEIQTFSDDQMFKRIKSLQNSIGDFIDRAQFGDFTDREIRMFVGRKVDPSGNLCRGLRGPAAAYREGVKARYTIEIKPTIEQEVSAERTEQDNAAGKAAFAEIMGTLKSAPSISRPVDREKSREQAIKDIKTMKAAS